MLLADRDWEQQQQHNTIGVLETRMGGERNESHALEYAGSIIVGKKTKFTLESEAISSRFAVLIKGEESNEELLWFGILMPMSIRESMPFIRSID